MKKYSFQMTREEISELCLRARWENLLLRRFKWLLLPAVLTLECIFVSWTMALATLALMLLIFAALIMWTDFVMKKQLYGKTRTMEVEGGVLKSSIEGEVYCEIPCSSITEIRTTRHLLMLGLRQTSKVIGWYPVPLRVFADGQERDSFSEAVRNPQTVVSNPEEHEETFATDPGVQAAERSEQEYFRVSFQVGEEEWVRMMTTATEIIRAGTLGEQKKYFFRIVLAAVFSALLYGAALFFSGAADIMRSMFLVGSFFFLILLWILLGNPERNIRTQLRKGMMQNNVLGVWEISVTDAGIRQSISEDNSALIPWESLLCVVETDNGLFFYRKEKRHFIAIQKSGPESREQIESLKELCREKHVEVLAGKRKKYVPTWLFVMLIVVMYVGYMVSVVSGGVRKDTVPDYTSLNEQVSVLRSLGFTIPEEMEDTLCTCIEENGMNSYVERYPYTWLLSNLAWADAEEWADWAQDGAAVFWFDFEGWDISTDYVMILEGMQKLSAGSILDDVENIREDTGNVDWEKGTGTITVSLKWKGQEHSWKMDMENDWIDPEVLGIYNGLLEKEGVPERFYVTGDDGQGAFVFYCTGEWASAFEDATGLDLETCMVKKGW
ncbi:MAG: YcxB family protein [Acetatifactor sp.]|nr:YcxB family protein [Acetatifactor sp.]